MTVSFDDLQAALGDRYRIERELGRGGMATVYLATDRSLERRVALKVLHRELATRLGPERFQQEIRTAAPAASAHPPALRVGRRRGSTLRLTAERQ